MGIFTWLSRANVFLQLDDTGSTGMTIHRRTREEKTIYRQVKFLLATRNWLHSNRSRYFTRIKDCYLHGYGCLIMQLNVSSHANCIIESLLLKTECPKVQMIVVSRQRIFFSTKMKIHLQSMNVK